MITVKLNASMQELYDFLEHRFADELERHGSRRQAKLSKWFVGKLKNHIVCEVDQKILYVEKQESRSSFVIGAFTVPKNIQSFLAGTKTIAYYGVRLEQEQESLVEFSIDNLRSAKKLGFFPISVDSQRSKMRLLIKVVLAILILLLSVFFILLLLLMVGLLGWILYDEYKKRRGRIYEKETMGLIAGVFALEYNHDSTLIEKYRASRRRWWFRAALHEVLDFFDPAQPEV